LFGENLSVFDLPTNWSPDGWLSKQKGGVLGFLPRVSFYWWDWICSNEGARSMMIWMELINLVEELTRISEFIRVYSDSWLLAPIMDSYRLTSDFSLKVCDL
jgi:hypothetical protein